MSAGPPTTALGAFLLYRDRTGNARFGVDTGSSLCAPPSQIGQFRGNSRRLRSLQPFFMNASAHGDVPRSRRLDGHRFEARRGRLAHLIDAYLDEMSKAAIGLVGHVLERLGDGLMALFRYDAAQENDSERTGAPVVQTESLASNSFGALSCRRAHRSGARWSTSFPPQAS
jgi:hypothetical protein